MGFEPGQSQSHTETVNEFKDRMEKSLEEVRSALAKAKDNMAQYYNRKRTPAPEYKVGDCVYLDALDIQTTWPSKKLAHHYFGPYVIQQRVGHHAYWLCLPSSMSHLHPVFNVVKLVPALEDPIPGQRSDPPPPLEIVDGEEHYVVEKILDSRLIHNKLHYLVQWEGYGYKENAWVVEEDVAVPRKVRDFYALHPEAPWKIQALAFESLVSHASRTQHPRKGGDVRGTLGPISRFPSLQTPGPNSRTHWFQLGTSQTLKGVARWTRISQEQAGKCMGQPPGLEVGNVTG